MPSLPLQRHADYGPLTTVQIGALTGMLEGDRAYDATLGIPQQRVDAGWAAAAWRSMWHLPDNVPLLIGEGGVGVDFEMSWNAGGNRVDVLIAGNLQLIMEDGLWDFILAGLRVRDNETIAYGLDDDILTQYVSASNKWSCSFSSQLGVTALFEWDIPIGAGGAAAAALDYQFMLDGELSNLIRGGGAGLLAETDGSGTYRESVWKIPHYAGDYSGDWSTIPLPTPASLVDGGIFTAFNSNGGVLASRLYGRSNGAWGFIDFTSG